MYFPGVLAADEEVLKKISFAKMAGKWIDGHGPGMTGKELNAYVSAGIIGDHECSMLEEMEDRLERGQYILLREGTACII